MVYALIAVLGIAMLVLGVTWRRLTVAKSRIDGLEASIRMLEERHHAELLEHHHKIDMALTLINEVEFADCAPYHQLFAGKVGESVGYLPLLGLGPAAASALQFIRSCGDFPGREQRLSNLLARDHWRGHLVACVSMLLFPHPERHSELLWSRLDEGSWVSPQLAVALSFLDPAFDTHVSNWMRQLMDTQIVDWGTAKTTGALLSQIADEPLRRELAESVSIRDASKGDVDDGARIAMHWRKSWLEVANP